MGRLAEKAEEAFECFDNGDLLGFATTLMDAADYNVQSKKARLALDEFVKEHLRTREPILIEIRKILPTRT